MQFKVCEVRVAKNDTEFVGVFEIGQFARKHQGDSHTSVLSQRKVVYGRQG